jgi:DNA polymerase-3 subunit beta
VTVSQSRSEGLAKVVGIIEKKTTMPILSNVLLDASDGVLTFRATDLDIEAVTKVPCTVINPGSSTVTADLLSGIVKKYKSGPLVSIEVDNSTMKISQGRSKFNLAVMSTEDYPTLANEDYESTFTMSGSDLSRMFTKTVFAASTEEAKYYLQGVYFHTTEKGIIAAATDGHKLAVSWADQVEDFTGVIVPRKTVLELCKVLEDEEVDVSVSGGKIRFNMGETIITSKVIDGTFPDYARIIPTSNSNTMTVDALEFADASSMVAMVCEDKQSRSVTMDVTEGSVCLYVKGSNNNAENQIDAEVSGDDVKMAFNSKYLAETMSKSDGGNVTMKYKDPMTPGLFTMSEDERFMAVIMPMRA